MEYKQQVQYKSCHRAIRAFFARCIRFILAKYCRNYSKVLFLDFDGVLAPLDDDANVGHDKFGTRFDASCVENLNRIISATATKIVITSSWRGYLSLWQIMKMWECRGLEGDLVGTTQRTGNNRSKEIDAWLKHHNVYRYVIIDDMDIRQFAYHHHSCLTTGVDITPAGRIIKSTYAKCICQVN